MPTARIQRERSPILLLDEGRRMKRAWSTGNATLHGDNYQVDGARLFPLPLQEGGIPNAIVAQTEAEVADCVNALEPRVTPHLGEEGAAKFVPEYQSVPPGVGTPEQEMAQI